MNSITINARVAFAGWNVDKPRRGSAAARFRDEVHAACKADGVPLHTGPVALKIRIAGQDKRLKSLDMLSAVARALEGQLYESKSQVVGWVSHIERDSTAEPTVCVEWMRIEDGNEKSV